MSSYFDEHNCEPLADGHGPNDLLHFARLLIDGGYAREYNMDFEGLFPDSQHAPPASKKVVEMLPDVDANDIIVEEPCPICLVPIKLDDKLKKLQCEHCFHTRCILPWLGKTNSCPLCRQELPTDDPSYEELKRQKAREKQRQLEIETLHDSMFG